MVNMHKICSLMVLGMLPVLAASCAREEAVSFSAQVKPFLDANCLECHRDGGEGYTASGFSVESYESLMKGTHYGPMVVPGDPLGSNMLVLMEGRADPSISMPHGARKPLARQDIETVRNWIAQGAKNN